MISLSPRGGRKHARLPDSLNRLVVGLVVALATSVAVAPSAWALSEIKREELPAPATTPTQPTTDNPENAVPLPDPIAPSTDDDPDKTGPTTPGEATDPDVQSEQNAPLPEILYDFSTLPPAVKRTRDLVL